ncbi:hypothetical protein MMC25_004011 [Agyrium rufum]|nr:hypothetical protein [Agyrium rufum]
MSSGAINGTFVTINDLGPAVNVVTWVLGAATGLTILTRFATKYALSRRPGIDDAAIVLATIFSVGLDTDYAGGLLYVLSLTFSKISIQLLLYSLTPVASHVCLALTLGALIVTWGVSAVFSAAFRCHTPLIWHTIGGQCFHQNAFWTYFGISNIIIEATLVALPVVIIGSTQMPIQRKISIGVYFMTRLAVMGSIVSELVFRHRNRNSQDPTYDAWPVLISLQFAQSLSIIIACIPYLKPFLLSIESGLIRTDDTRRLGGRSFLGYDISAKAGNPFNDSSQAKPSSGSKSIKLLSWPQSTLSRAEGKTTSKVASGEDHARWETESQASQSRFIRHTKTFAVEVDARTRSESSM